MNNTTIELIERYLLGELSGTELAAFENRVKAEPELAKEVAQYGELILAMKAYAKESVLRDKLKSIHQRMEPGQLRPISRSKRAPKTLSLILGTGAVAAGIALVVMLTVGKWIINSNGHRDEMLILKNEVAAVKDRLDSVEDSIFIAKYPEVSSMDVSFGTGFPISSNGYLLTSHHIVKDADRIFIELPGQKRFMAKMVYSDPAKDLAVLKTEDSNFTSFGKLPYSFSTKSSRLGDYVYTLGYSKQNVVFTEGSVSSLTGFNEDTFAYQVSIPANPGNSGGPVLDEQGNIIGLLSGKHSVQEGAAFSIKSGYITSLVDEMTADEAFSDLSLPKGKSLPWLKRADQVEKLHEYIYKVRVYSK